MQIDGVGQLYGGVYTLSATSHVYRVGQGYETRFAVTGRSPRSLVDLLSPAPVERWGGSVVVGIVTQNSDPDGMGRVRVRYPALGDDIEGWWARIASPAAGSERGLLMMPIAGDEVLVAFEHGDVRRPYVLGSLWNGSDQPGDDLVQTDGSFALRSDHKASVHAADAITIETDADVEITAERQASRRSRPTTRPIEGQNVNVKANSSLTIEATGDLTIKGASITVQASGAVSVSGAPIVTRMSMHGDFIGSGLAFPLRVDRQGALALVTHDDDIREAIAVILGTMPGERPMRPAVRLRDPRPRLLRHRRPHARPHRPRRARRARPLGAARAGARRSTSTCPSATPGRLLIDITYRIRSTNDVRNLVYPFYLVPSEEESLSLPQVELDDRRFQDLVNEARTRIARACPEWTEHNVSDPGITLIELFAWMTDMLVYRLNRVPDKLHVALLELLGITLAPPAPAATEVRFRLAAAAVEPVPVPAWDTEVGTRAHAARRVDRVPDRRPTSPSRRCGRRRT